MPTDISTVTLIPADEKSLFYAPLIRAIDGPGLDKVRNSEKTGYYRAHVIFTRDNRVRLLPTFLSCAH